MEYNLKVMLFQRSIAFSYPSITSALPGIYTCTFYCYKGTEYELIHFPLLPELDI